MLVVPYQAFTINKSKVIVNKHISACCWEPHIIQIVLPNVLTAMMFSVCEQHSTYLTKVHGTGEVSGVWLKDKGKVRTKGWRKLRPTVSCVLSSSRVLSSTRALGFLRPTSTTLLTHWRSVYKVDVRVYKV